MSFTRYFDDKITLNRIFCAIVIAQNRKYQLNCKFRHTAEGMSHVTKETFVDQDENVQMLNVMSTDKYLIGEIKEGRGGEGGGSWREEGEDWWEIWYRFTSLTFLDYLRLSHSQRLVSK